MRCSRRGSRRSRTCLACPSLVSQRVRTVLHFPFPPCICIVFPIHACSRVLACVYICLFSFAAQKHGQVWRQRIASKKSCAPRRNLSQTESSRRPLRHTPQPPARLRTWPRLWPGCRRLRRRRANRAGSRRRAALALSVRLLCPLSSISPRLRSQPLLLLHPPFRQPQAPFSHHQRSPAAAPAPAAAAAPLLHRRRRSSRSIS